MNPLKIYNSLSREKEIFAPINPPYAGMYVCGPTVSGETHLGHSRPYVTFDIVYRFLQYSGYKVRYVRNITDAGHFEEEDKDAVDKVAVKAKLEQLEPMELVQKYTNIYHDMMDKLNVIRPSIEPTATGHIVEQISMIEDIIAKGFAYVVNGSVYFDVTRYAKQHDYGRLSGRKIEEMIAGSRELEGQGEKRNPADFALWKNAPPEHLMRWKSPWGEGFPGWHIECSAMSSKYLGIPFDIHGGGMDLLFPHHESEIAQTKIATGLALANYWMHNNMITIKGQKMSKSLGNTITIAQMFSGGHPLLEQGYSPMTLRFFILQTHYRSTLDFSNEALLAAEKGLQRLMNALDALNKLSYKENAAQYKEEENNQVLQLMNSCTEYMNDDFNTAMAMASLFELSSKIFSWKNEQLAIASIKKETFELLVKTFNAFVTDIFGLKNEKENDDSKMNGLMELLISLRKEARSKKDFATSDKIRDDLFAAGIQLKDGKEGTSWEGV
ncbi:MAG: cysteine--tRNA ligase [Chitinophagaceae bacterium]|nr:cysteine--tRNA ligase [Chitinophagaceae bacterium]